jgi:hypothetical protein
VVLKPSRFGPHAYGKGVKLEKKIYPAVNRCIYCEASPSPELLGDEHIIPFGLNGNLVLPKASCAECGRVTGTVVEQEVLRKMLIDIRTHHKMNTRRPKDRPTKLRVARFRRDKSFERWDNVSLSDHPFAMFLPNFALPTEITGGPHHNGFIMHGGGLYAPPEFIPLLTRFGPGAGYVQMFHPEMFCRMVAKIAHSYAVAELGMNSFEPFLPDVILGKAPSISRFVGTLPFRSAPTEQLHRLSINRAKGLVQVQVRLFAKYGGPIYLVDRFRRTTHVMPPRRAYRSSCGRRDGG